MEETTAEYATNELIPSVELRFIPKVTIGAKTDLGRVRENNEDKFEYFIPEDHATLASRGLVFVVCDGMGGHAAGQIASELASKTFIDVYLSHPGNDPKEAMTSAVLAANRYVYMVASTNPSRRGMGTTFTGLTLVQNRGFAVQVGDSRLYRLRNQVFEQITHDHTYMSEMIRMGTLTPEQAESHPHKHVLTRAVGVEEVVMPDLFEFEIVAGDVYLLCSDGILNHVSDAEIEIQLQAAQTGGSGPGSVAWKLVNQALVGGGSDNATAMVIRIDAMEEVQEPAMDQNPAV